MKVNHLSNSEPVNESERLAINLVSDALKRSDSSSHCYLLSNVQLVTSPAYQPSEIDLLLILPTGVQVIEVKHWTRSYIDNNSHLASKQADILTEKVKRLASLFGKYADIGHLSGRMLLTNENKIIDETHKMWRGIKLFSTKEIKKIIIPESQVLIGQSQMETLVKQIVPTGVQITKGGFRRIRDFVNLEEQAGGERFHRVYRGRHGQSGDKIVLHIYDLSADTGSCSKENAEILARREYETLLSLQASRAAHYLPRLRDSFQDLPEYPGEMAMFSVFDPCAPTLEVRGADKNWSDIDRIKFAAEAFIALDAIHNPESKQPFRIVHRNLSPSTIHIASQGEPILSGLDIAKISEHATISNYILPESQFAAPELKDAGLAVADQRSDVYSMSASLLDSLNVCISPDVDSIRQILRKGVAENPDNRPSAKGMFDELHGFLSKQSKLSDESSLPLPRYWSEGMDIEFKNKSYRIISRLGSGGVGITFKVCALKENGEEFGTYVAKAIEDESKAKFALDAYMKVRHLTGRRNLAVIFEHANIDEWSPYSFVALLNWVEGESLAYATDIFTECTEGNASFDDVAVDLALHACEAMDELHRHDLVHGDISPENMIYRTHALTLTDYDLLTPIGQKPPGLGKLLYCAPEMQQGASASTAADIYALGATFANIILRHPPFPESNLGGWDKTKPVSFSDEERKNFPRMSSFIEMATNPDPALRIINAGAAIDVLKSHSECNTYKLISKEPHLTANHVPWLKQILTAYPGSMYGNAETRGLDSDFAAKTYISTAFEDDMVKGILDGCIQLLILTGNAGDGKTAMLQHISQRLGMERKKSSERIWRNSIETLNRTRNISVNLDGSAAHNGRSADELLDEFMAPFMNNMPPNDATHLLAINDGRLAEWLTRFDKNDVAVPLLVDSLNKCLRGNTEQLPPHLRFINLNDRSLVGSVIDDNPESNFALCLLDKFIGGGDVEKIWEPCKACLANDRCAAWMSIKTLCSPVGRRVRESIIHSFKAVHMRGEKHITARELRASLSYIFFNVYDCEDLHQNQDLTPTPYWDMVFAPDTPYRQGNLLHELTMLDPALDSHPTIDRYLVGKSTYDTEYMSPRYMGIQIGSARRRAFFEWTPEQINKVAGSLYSLGLLDGQFYDLFLYIEKLSLDEYNKLCIQLCSGLAKLDDLPRHAFRKGEIPIRLIPRSPTETIFWVVKSAYNFRIELEKPQIRSDLPFLHSHLKLTYQFANGSQESLTMGYDLFRTLLELNSGLQLVGQDSDDLFANLDDFTRRLAQEDAQIWRAWTPAADPTVYELSIHVVDEAQQLRCQHLNEETLQ